MSKRQYNPMLLAKVCSVGELVAEVGRDDRVIDGLKALEEHDLIDLVFEREMLWSKKWGVRIPRLGRATYTATPTRQGRHIGRGYR